VFRFRSDAVCWASTGEVSVLALSTYCFSSETENVVPQWEFKFNSVLAAAAIWHLKGRELKVKTTFNHCRPVQPLEVNVLVVLFHRPACTL